MPLMIQRMFSDLPAVAAGVAVASTVQGQPRTKQVASASSSVAVDAVRFIREFLDLTGNTEEWETFKTFAGALGYDNPVEPPKFDYLNPDVIVSDGWSSTDKVDYMAATRSLVVTPLMFRSGGPEKFALTYDPEVTPAVIGTESSVREVKLIKSTFDENDKELLMKSGLEALGSNRPVMWLIRHSEYHSRFDEELRLALGGRLPMSMWNGDIDATVMPHTTFEEFASDLNMAPESLAYLLLPGDDKNQNDAIAARVPSEVRALLSMFFSPGTTEETKAMFRNPEMTYGITNMKFSSVNYFISARSSAMQFASLIALQPVIGRTALNLVSKELTQLIVRKSVVYATIVADPLQPLLHGSSFKDIVVIDEQIGSAWGVTFPSRNF
jgi:hypothetical protein